MRASSVHENVRINPLCRLVWTSTAAREYWNERLQKIQDLVKEVRLVCFKRGILPTYACFVKNEEKEPELHDTMSLLDVRAIASPHREHKHYAQQVGSTGRFRLYSKKVGVPVLARGTFTLFDLNLTLGYSNADRETCKWYAALTKEGIYDPIGEMEDRDSMNFYLNPFLRHIGVSLLPYVAPSWSHAYSLELAKKVLSVAQEIDEELARDLVALLEMPTRWNCWRGVTIVDTPIFKTITDSVAYREKVIVDYELTDPSIYARHDIPCAAHGTEFPYLPKAAVKLAKRMQAHKEGIHG